MVGLNEVMDRVSSTLLASDRTFDCKLVVAEIIKALPARSIAVFGGCSVGTDHGQCSLLRIPDDPSSPLALSGEERRMAVENAIRLK